ncbi:hypothetical protein [Virgibacillus chiguensis]|nr:hypothetical protein [Virgibacillus chiguensis]
MKIISLSLASVEVFAAPYPLLLGTNNTSRRFQVIGIIVAD